MLRYLRHPNVVAFFGACVDTDLVEMALVFEYIPKGLTLHKVVTGQDLPVEVTTKNMLDILWDVCCGVYYMHSVDQPILHRDIKPANILVHWYVTSGPLAKLADFGLSHHIGKSKTRGTLRFMAPEAIRGDPVNTSVDVFSFGRVIYFATTGKVPLGEIEQATIRKAATHGSSLPLVWPLNPTLPLRDLANKCMTANPMMRPRIGEVWNTLKGMTDFTQRTLGSGMTDETASLESPDEDTDVAHNLPSVSAAADVVVRV